MSKIFVTSDNHFSHRNISKFCPSTRPDSDPAVMDEKMIAQWQNQVRPNDTVWMLGDVFWSHEPEAIAIMDRLPGKKHLVFGNHDDMIRNNSTIRNKFESTQEYKEISFNGNRMILFHYPIQEWHKCHSGSINCYGHIHHAVSGVEGRTVNVCVDSPDMYNGIPYRLYPMQEVVDFALKFPARGDTLT
jgi:calcineurin-like phosphoesterase family protein